MKALLLSFTLAVLSSTAAHAATTCRKRVPPSTCPPPGFDSLRNFDLTKYVSAPWYIQKQLPLVYQPPSELFCVRATYKLRSPGQPKDGVIVFNYANRGKVNGPSTGTSLPGSPMGRTIAVLDDSASGASAASKLRVGPEALQMIPGDGWKKAFGGYWVVAVGPSKNATLGYDWAIVSGGSPTVKSEQGCRAGTPGDTKLQYFGGLWFFSRKPTDVAGTKAMLRAAAKLGLDTSALVDVPQKGCTYMA